MSVIYRPPSRLSRSKFFAFQGNLYVLESVNQLGSPIPESADDADLPDIALDLGSDLDIPNMLVPNSNLPEIDDGPRISDSDDICFACSGTGKSQTAIGRAADLSCVICDGSGHRWMG